MDIMSVDEKFTLNEYTIMYIICDPVYAKSISDFLLCYSVPFKGKVIIPSIYTIGLNVRLYIYIYRLSTYH